MGIRIVPSAEEYAERFHRCLDTVAQERRYLSFLKAPSLDATLEFLRGLLAGGGVQFLALTGDDGVVGWCDISRGQQEHSNHAGRLGMGVLAEHRGRGIGKALAGATIRAAQAEGMERIELEVYASNAAAIGLYEKLGFGREGVRVRARKLDGEYDDVVLMALLER